MVFNGDNASNEELNSSVVLALAGFKSCAYNTNIMLLNHKGEGKNKRF